MSLKAFHVFFVIVSALFTSLLGVWLLRSNGPVAFAVGSLASSFILVLYGFSFLRKVRSIIT